MKSRREIEEDEFKEAVKARKDLEELTQKNQPKQPTTLYDVLKANKKLNQHIAQAGISIGADKYLGRSPEEMQRVVNEMIRRADEHQRKIKLVDDFLLSKNKGVTSDSNNKPHVGLKAWGVRLPSWRREQNNE